MDGFRKPADTEIHHQIRCGKFKCGESFQDISRITVLKSHEYKCDLIGVVLSSWKESQAKNSTFYM